jgi:hypothetical protein
MTRRRRNPELNQSIFSEQDEAEIRTTLTYGLLASGEAEHARKELLLPMIKNLRGFYEGLEHEITDEMLRSDSFDPLRSDLSPAEAKLSAEHSLVKIMLIMLARLNRVIDADAMLSPMLNPRRRRLKRHY